MCPTYAWSRTRSRAVCMGIHSTVAADKNSTIEVSRILGSVKLPIDHTTFAPSALEVPSDNFGNVVMSYETILNDTVEPVEVWMKNFGDSKQWPPGDQILQPGLSTKAFQMPLAFLHAVCVRYRDNNLQER